MHDHRHDCSLGRRLHHLEQAVLSFQSEQLTALGLTIPQARAVGQIGAAVDHGRPMRQRDLALALGIRGPSVTSLLQGLEKRGLVARNVSGGDGRARELSLTGRGKELLWRCQGLFGLTEERLSEPLTEGEQAEMCRLLDKINARFAPVAHSDRPDA